MGLERKVRFGGRSVLMGNGTKEGVYEDMIDADYNSAMDGDWKTMSRKIGNPSPKLMSVSKTRLLRFLGLRGSMRHQHSYNSIRQPSVSFFSYQISQNGILHDLFVCFKSVQGRR